MKKILFTIFIGLTAISCLSEGEYSQTVPVYASFEYTDEVNFEADSTFYKSDFGYGVGWMYFAFRHNVDTSSWKFNGGLLVSAQKGTLYDPADTVALAKSDSLVFAQDRFRVNSVRDSLLNNKYLVYYGNPDQDMMPEHDVEFLAADFGTCTAYQCFVNNTGYVAYKVAQTFEPGDRLTLKATGYLAGAKTGEASITLADFSAQKDSIVSKWTTFDLSKLGNFDYIDFDVISTKEEVPAYFCLDYFVASVTIGND